MQKDKKDLLSALSELKLDRRFLMLAAGATAMAPGMLQAAETAKEGDESELVEFLFVQASDKVSLEKGVLRLKDANQHTVYFSDRPERIAGAVSTKDFVEHWATGDESFKADPPNAVLVLNTGDEPIVSAVVLHEPRFEGADLIYDVEVIGGHDSIEGGFTSLFIDIIGMPMTPLSFAGVHRRWRRRVLWR